MSEVTVNIVKGSRIRANWFQASDPPSCLAGMQMKVGATQYMISGVVRHVRKNNPIVPTETMLYVDPDNAAAPWNGPLVDIGCNCGHKHVAVQPQHVTYVEPT